MAEYYIRTPDRDESRGPFTPEQLLTLVEAEQVTLDTLYYDEAREEWLPVGTNIELREEIFPQKEKLQLKLEDAEEPKGKEKKKKKKKEAKAKEKAKSTVSDMLAVAETDTKNARSKRRRESSFKWAIHLVNNGLCLAMLLSAATLIFPHLPVLKEVFVEKAPRLILNYPLILLGVIDILLAVYIYFGERKLYSIVRGRAMLALGFGAYVGWALGDTYVLLASICFGVGTVWATIVKSFSTGFLSVAISLAGSAFLAYLSFYGYFDGFLDSINLHFFTVD